MEMGEASSRIANDDSPGGTNKEDATAEFKIQTRRHKKKQLGKPVLFAICIEEQYYRQCLSSPLPPVESLPTLHLPLRIHLIRSPSLGCSTELNPTTVTQMVDRVNQLWSPAGIVWRLESTPEPDLTTKLSEEKLAKLKHDVVTHVTRQDRGVHQRSIFLKQILSLLHYQDQPHVFDVYMFDLIGQTLQGVCICRKTRTMLLGERSNKGYADFTARPHDCLAKTMAHELGHALGLRHIRQRAFEDGCKMNVSGVPNLMEGGEDRRGGGGEFLEEWQVCLAREDAERFLQKYSTG